MQILDYSQSIPEIKTYSDETGHYIEGYLIGTKPTNHERNNPFDEFAISKETGHDKVKSFKDRHFAIIPELIKPGEGGHFWALGKDAIAKGYKDHSHGIIIDTPGPFKYDDNSDDYYYNFRAKLAGSKAASALLTYGAKTWVPYAVSPHIWDYPELNQNPMDIKTWDGLGIALVIKGAYGPNAVITKLCKGTESACMKGKGASTFDQIFPDDIEIIKDLGKPLCNDQDNELANIISSLVGRAGSIQSAMDNNKDSPNVPDNSKAVDDQTNKSAPNTNTKPNIQIESQNGITNAPLQQTVVIEANKLKALEERAEAFTEMENERKSELLNTMFSHVKDEKERVEKTKGFHKLSMKEVKMIKQYYDEVLPLIKKASEEPKPEDTDQDESNNKPTSGAKSNNKTGKGKGASSLGSGLRSEPPIPNDEGEGRAGSIQTPVNEIAQLRSALFNRRMIK